MCHVSMQGRSCDLLSYENEIVARGMAYVSQVHEHIVRCGHRVRKISCYKVRVKEVLQRDCKLPIPDDEVKILVSGCFILWPKFLITFNSEVGCLACSLYSLKKKIHG